MAAGERVTNVERQAAEGIQLEVPSGKEGEKKREGAWEE